MNNYENIKLPLGISSAIDMPNGIIFGASTSEKIYLLKGDWLGIIYQSGDQYPVKNMISLSNSFIAYTIGGKLRIMNLGGTANGGNFGDLFYADEDDAGSLSVTVKTSLDLDNETITDMIQLADTGYVVLSTSNGRILSFNPSLLTGNSTTVYADARNGFGISNSASTNFTYSLYKTIAEVTEDREIEKWTFASNAVAIFNEQVIGEFVGPVIHVKEDLGFWKQVIWSETKPDNTDIIISIRSGDSSEELLSAPWSFSFMSNTGEASPIIRDLNNITIKGQYLQLKVKMVTNANNITPIVSNVIVKYSTKQASYFFTTKFSFAKNSSPNNGLLVANITEPQNTEVHIGVSTKNSNDWADYQIIDPEKLFALTDENMQNIKVGIKFVSYDTSVPEVAEFALFVGGEQVKILTT